MANLKSDNYPHKSPNPFAAYLLRKANRFYVSFWRAKNDVEKPREETQLSSFTYEFGSFNYIHYPSDSVKDQASFMTALARHIGSKVLYNEADYVHSPRDGKAIYAV